MEISTESLTLAGGMLVVSVVFVAGLAIGEESGRRYGANAERCGPPEPRPAPKQRPAGPGITPVRPPTVEWVAGGGWGRF